MYIKPLADASQVIVIILPNLNSINAITVENNIHNNTVCFNWKYLCNTAV